jgi:hypothetical protein
MIVQESYWLYFEGCNDVQFKSSFTQMWRKNLMILGYYFYIEGKQSLNRPIGDPEGSRSLRLPDFETIDT